MSVPEQRPQSIVVHEAWLPDEHPLHRPRHGRRQRIALISALLFFATPVLAAVAGVQPAEFENRALASAPSPADGWGFFTELPAWAADHLPFRHAAVRATGGVSRGVFGEPAPLDSKAPVAPAASGPIAPAPPDVDVPHAAGFPSVIEGEHGWLYFGYDVEGKCAPVRPLDDTIAALQRLRSAVESSGRQFVLVVAPDKSTAVPQHLPADYPGRECAQSFRDEFWHRVTREAGALDVRPALRAVADAGLPIYQRLDTHWTDVGSLTMVRAVAEEIRPGVSHDWVVEPERTGSFEADLPRLLGQTGQAYVQRYALAPDGVADRTRATEGDMRTGVRFESRPVSGMVTRPVAMMTDSFALPASPYLYASFSDLRAIYYGTAATALDAVVGTITSGEVVVLEIAERNLAAGLSSILGDPVLDRIAAELRAQPVR